MYRFNRKTLSIAGAAVVGLLVLGTGLFLAKDYLWPAPHQAVVGEPVDIVLDFYDPWLTAAQSTTTDPYKEGLAKASILSKELRKKLAGAKGRSDTEPDPVLCNVILPLEISARPVSQIDGIAQVLVLSRTEGQEGQALVYLTQEGEGWYIADIVCSPGEFGPEREFSFDTEGFLLKSVPAPYDSQYWHLVFEERGEPGHAAPLFFDAQSTCVALDKSEAVCDPSTFVEPSKAYVRGQMTETGVQVQRIELLKE